MKLVMKYLKPHLLLVFVCIICLFGQVVCDLTLPNLMSNIVNVGIQQGGLEEGAPKAISENGMELLEYFMTDEESQLMEKGYHFVMPQSSEAMRNEEEYPLVKESPVYILSTRDELEIESINRIYGKASFGLMEFLKNMETQDMSQMQGMPQGGDFEYPADGGEITQNGDFQSPQGNGETSQGRGSQTPSINGDIPQGSENSPGMNEENSLASSALESLTAGMTLDNAPKAVAAAAVSEVDPDTLGEDAEWGGESAVPYREPYQTESGETPDVTGETEEKKDDADGTDEEDTGFGDMDASELYGLLPVLAQYPDYVLQESMDAADNAEESFRAQIGINFTRLFYKEVGIDIDAVQHDYIFNTGMQMIGVALVVVAAAVALGFMSSRIAADVARRMRHDLFSKVESFASAEYDKFSTASLITRTTNDVQQVQMLVTMGIRMLCYAPMMGIGGIMFALDKSPSLSWIIVLTVVVLLGIILVLMAAVMPKFKILQKLTDKLNLVSRESLSGMLVIRAFGNEAHEEKRFEKANRELSDTNLFVQRVMSAVMPSMMFIMNLATLLIVWFGSKAISEATLQIGDMIAFIQYAMQVIIAFLMIAMLFVFVPRALVSAKRISEVLGTENKIKDPAAPKKLQNAKGKIVFDNVSFQYPGAEEKVLENISFTALPGQTTAFIGATGSGKSTLINLVPRFYEVTEGSISIDGVDIRDIAQHDLRNNIGYVPQKGLLFSGDIASNLQFGKEDATESEMRHAIQVAQAADFVYSEEAGTSLPIAQGGTNVSGGQRQRLSIARALVKNAPVYIFDDSFSALDFKTDAKLRRALKQDTADSTMLIVAQRVGTIMNAEQIVVLDRGKMVGKGTHKELLKNCPEYREIAESQMAKEELE